MKNKFFKMLAIVLMLPMMLFTGCKNDDEGLISETEIKEKYFNAVEKARNNTMLIYSVKSKTTQKGSSGLETYEETTEDTYTSDGENYYFQQKQGNEVIKISIIKLENNQYIKYTDDGNKTTSFVTLNDFIDQVNVFSVDDDTIFGQKSEYELKEFANRSVKELFSFEDEDFETVEDAVMTVDLADKNSYLMTLTAGGIVKRDSSYAKVLLVFKVWFNDYITKFTSSYQVIELNQDKTVKENGNCFSFTSEATINYEFDESLKISDFSDYPSIG